MNKKYIPYLIVLLLCFNSVVTNAQKKYLSGIYTVGGNNANYSSIQKAVTELLNVNTEVIGRVTFNIRPGVYAENLVIKPYKGASSKNTVIFKSETGKATDVTIADDGDNTLYNNQVIRLEGCSYVVFQDLTIENNRKITATNNFASVFHLTYNRDKITQVAEYNSINRCIIKTDSTFTIFNGNTIGIVSSDINNTSGLANCANYNTITNCTFYGGTFGIRLLGKSLTQPAKGNKITNNKFFKCYSGIDIDYNNIPNISNNLIVCRANANESQFGIRVRNAAGNFGFYNNQIKNYGTFGMFFYNVNGGSQAYIYNNLIYGNVKATYSRGIHVEFCRTLQFLNNTIHYTSTFSTEKACFVIENSAGLPSTRISIKNNIFYAKGGATSVIIRSNSTLDTSNYNDYFLANGTTIGIINGINCTTMALLRSNTGKDAQSLNLNPNFPNDTLLRLNNKALIRRAFVLPFIAFDFENQKRDPETPDIGADEVIRSPYDLEVFGLNKNFVPREGDNIIPLVIKNDALLSLNSLNKIAVRYRINNGAFNPVDSFTLTQLSLPYSKQQFNLSTLWNIPSPGNYVLEIRVEPAFQGDTWFDNDTLILNICVGLNGRYTIGGPANSKNYPTFAAAIAAFDCGVGGKTVFDIYPGTYTTPFIIPVIKGASEDKTVTFRSFSGNPADVIIQNNIATQTAINHYVIQVDGGDFVRFNNLTLTNTSTSSFASGFHITNSANDIRIDSCIINLPNSTNSNDNKFGVVAAFKTKIDSATKANNLTVINSTIKGGTNGIQFVGQTGLNRSTGAVIYNNKIDSSFFYAINLVNASIKSISLNNISMKLNGSINSEGIRIIGSKSDGVINGNKLINTAFRGISLSSMEGATAVIVSNNMIAGGFRTAGSGAGIYFTEVNKINVYHNSVYYDKVPVNSPNNSAAFFLASGVNVTLNNNIFFNPAGGYAFFVTSQTSIRNSDNNLYYTDADPNQGNFAYYGGDRLNLTSLKAAMIGFELKTLETNPNFVSTTDLHTVNPLLDNKGIYLSSVANDIDKQARNPLNSDIGADEFILNAKDMALLEVFPLVFSTDPNTISVKIMNLGSTNLNSQPVKLQYSTAAGVWVPTIGETFTAITATPNALDTAYSSALYSFVTPFNATLNQSYQLMVRIDPANRIAGDPITSNDSILNVTCTGLKSGVYTIGGVSPNFIDFNAAANALACGVTGPVTFNVRPGTYNERFTINNPKNTSATNLIVFQSESGNAADVLIKSNGVSANTTRNVIRLNRSKYVQLKKLSIENLSNSIAGSAAIQITSDARNILIRDCIIKMDTNTTSPNVYGITTSDSTNITSEGKGGSDISIINNQIYGASSAIHVRGTSQYIRDFGISIDSNRIFNPSSFGIFSSNVDLKSINQNQINMRKDQSTSVGINVIINRADTRITNNKVIRAATVGLAINDALGLNGLLVANNMIGGGFKAGVDGIGVSIDKVSPLAFYYNSVNYDGSSVNSVALKIDVDSRKVRLLNNSIYNSTNGFALLIEDPTSIDTSENNNFATKSGLFARVGGVDYLNFDEYRDFYPIDINSISVDPDYFTATDLRLTNTFLDAAAIPVEGIDKDIQGNVRDLNFPDIGADEFLVKGDVEIVSIDNPLPPPELYPTLIPVVVTIKNGGLSKVSGLNVKYFINNVEKANEVIPVEDPYRPLLPSDVLTYTFDTMISPTTTGIYTLRVEAYLLNDTTPLNNIASTTFYSSISSIIDGKLEAYVSPVNSTVEQFTPIIVIIKNTGTDTISNFNINYQITATGGPVTRTELITDKIAPQELLSHTFTDLIDCSASAVRVLKSYLSDVTDDLNQSNDTATMFIFPFSPCGVGINNPDAVGFVVATPWPNPTSTVLNYSISIPNNGDVELKLIDVLGQIVSSTNYSGLSTGVNSFQLPVSQLPAGIYYSQMYFDGKIVNHRIVIAK